MLKIADDPYIEVAAEPVGPPDLDELCRLAAQQMLAVALEAERRAYLDAHAGLVGEDGRRVVVGNGYLPTREVTTGAGAVEVKAPRVHDPRPEERFTSAVLPRYMRRSPKVTVALPVSTALNTSRFVESLLPRQQPQPITPRSNARRQISAADGSALR